MRALTAKSWSPYLVGFCIGLLSWFSFGSAGKLIGITTPFEQAMAMAARTASPSVEKSNAYFADKAKSGASPKVSWEWMLVAGVFVGAWLSARLSGDRPHGDKAAIPALWAQRFGDSRAKRYIGAFLGGAVMMLGARLAGGCTSGHGISGSLQLAVSSWIFTAVMFSTAIAAAFLLYGRTKGPSDV